MSGESIWTFRHHAMATHFEVRIAGVEKEYAGQAAAAAFLVTDQLEALMSRYRPDSEIAQIGRLQPGEWLRVSEPLWECLQTARRMEAVTGGAFSVTSGACRNQPVAPVWQLDADRMAVRCEVGQLAMDLGAIGKGFALDRMAVELAEWETSTHLLIAGGSSVLAGEAPPGLSGWTCGMGGQEDWTLTDASLSGSGLAVRGEHILHPATGLPGAVRERAWVLAPTAAESDALSTACMILPLAELEAIFAGSTEWLAILPGDTGRLLLGNRPPPLPAVRRSPS